MNSSFTGIAYRRLYYRCKDKVKFSRCRRERNRCEVIFLPDKVADRDIPWSSNMIKVSFGIFLDIVCGYGGEGIEEFVF